VKKSGQNCGIPAPQTCPLRTRASSTCNKVSSYPDDSEDAIGTKRSSLVETDKLLIQEKILKSADEYEPRTNKFMALLEAQDKPSSAVEIERLRAELTAMVSHVMPC
jgi:hypothetical protein